LENKVLDIFYAQRINEAGNQFNTI